MSDVFNEPWQAFVQGLDICSKKPIILVRAHCDIWTGIH